MLRAAAGEINDIGAGDLSHQGRVAGVGRPDDVHAVSIGAQAGKMTDAVVGRPARVLQRRRRWYDSDAGLRPAGQRQYAGVHRGARRAKLVAPDQQNPALQRNAPV